MTVTAISDNVLFGVLNEIECEMHNAVLAQKRAERAGDRRDSDYQVKRLTELKAERVAAFMFVPLANGTRVRFAGTTEREGTIFGFHFDDPRSSICHPEYWVEANGDRDLYVVTELEVI